MVISNIGSFPVLMEVNDSCCSNSRAVSCQSSLARSEKRVPDANVSLKFE